ncbi:hypothetical protein H0264_05230 [Nocardia huaxiensis]|uniref:LppU protein n=2 Tax=Nocardia huaxiensis TaxID=2755382 RepID=A0A7D6ZUE4_9NOCA|nr:hypothetical protein H0264_05230 [Nocardia huaxiensis]
MDSTATRRSRRLLPVAAVLAALALTGCSALQKGADAVQDVGKSDTARSKVGDCINVLKGSMFDSETEPVDCASPKAVYKVAQVHNTKTECASDYTSYEETLNGATRSFLCLAPNFQEGACYHESMLTGYQFAECASTEASFQVLSRIDGQSDENLCGADTDSVIILSDPRVTFCLQNV